MVKEFLSVELAVSVQVDGLTGNYMDLDVFMNIPMETYMRYKVKYMKCLVYRVISKRIKDQEKVY